MRGGEGDFFSLKSGEKKWGGGKRTLLKTRAKEKGVGNTTKEK